MINVTTDAAAVLGQSLATTEADESQALRLEKSQDGLALTLDQEREGDQVVRHEERTVLVVDQSISDSLDGATIDVTDTPEGKRLVVEAPQRG